MAAAGYVDYCILRCLPQLTTLPPRPFSPRSLPLLNPSPSSTPPLSQPLPLLDPSPSSTPPPPRSLPLLNPSPSSIPPPPQPLPLLNSSPSDSSPSSTPPPPQFLSLLNPSLLNPSPSSTPPPPLADLGFQAAQRIMSASPDLALKVMKDVAQNFPMTAK